MTTRRAVLLGMAAALAGCATPTALLPSGEGGGRSLSRTGRFVINVRQPNGSPEVVQGGFAWLDHGGQLTLDLTSPLGAALARLEVAADGRATLTEANGTVTRAPSADALIARVVGVDVPVASLRDWLAGELAPGLPARVDERDALGRPVRYQQAGWHVQASAADTEGPLRLRLGRGGAGAPEIDVRLAMQPVPAVP
ncbi:MAG: lipoprotein insertase outer membrane protein LolB [Pigmentiphaga sp.]